MTEKNQIFRRFSGKKQLLNDEERNAEIVPEPPDVEQLRQELQRENYKKRYLRVLRSTICALVVVAAIAVLVSVIFLPVLQIYGSSMVPTLEEGEMCIRDRPKRAGGWRSLQPKREGEGWSLPLKKAESSRSLQAKIKI